MADFDFKAASESMMDFIKKVETEIGPRLPGSDEERAGAKLIKEEYEKNIGIKPVSEPFKVAPESGIGSIPYIGIGGLIALIAFFIYPIAGAVIAALCFIYFALMGGFYTQIFDFLWKKKDTENFYTVQEPLSGKTDYTIVLSAHYDSSWNWNLAKKNPKTFIPKIVYGVVGLLSILVFGFVLQFAAGGAYANPLWTNAATITTWNGTHTSDISFPSSAFRGFTSSRNSCRTTKPSRPPAVWITLRASA